MAQGHIAGKEFFSSTKGGNTMKKFAVLFLAMAAVLVFGTAWAADTVSYTANMIDSVDTGHNLTSVKDDGNVIVITITNVRVTPSRNTNGRDLTTPGDVELYSAIVDKKGLDRPFAAVKVVNGTATFTIPNTAKRAGVPVVDHIWARANNGKLALVHDPADPWVCYKTNSDGSPNLQTLAIGVVMYPDRPTVPLMSLGQGKLDAEKHPELQ